MRITVPSAVFVRFVAAAVLICCAATQPSLAGKVEFVVRGPDGRPVANAEVRAASTEDRLGVDNARRKTVKTDAEGRVRLDWISGVRRIHVTVAGVGYGSTGLAEVVPDRTVQAPLAPLLPFAVLEGTIPPEARGPGVTLRMRRDEGFDESEPVAVDDAGSFRVEVPAGRLWLYASDGKRRVATLPQSTVLVAPGQRLAGLTFKVVPPPKEPSATTYVYMLPGKGQTVTWVRGTVRDEAGKPVEGAAVYASAVYDGGMRMYERVAKAVSDGEGRYQIMGEGGLSSFSASLVAHLPGRPPAWAWLQGQGAGELVPEGTPAPPAPEPPTVDMSLAAKDRGGRLAVTVLRDGRPAAGATVGVWLEGVSLRNIAAVRGGGDDADAEVRRIVNPVRATGADGVARFEALLPGRYQVVAAAGDERAVRLAREGLDTVGAAHAAAEGVPVRAGQATACRVALRRHAAFTARVRVMKHDATPLTGEHVPVDYGPIAGGGGGWSSSTKLDAEGLTVREFESPGLWRVGFKYRDSPTEWIPLRGEPYYGADGVVAVSPLLEAANVEPATLTAMRFDPAVVVVELKDADGRPLRGFVEVGATVGEPIMTGATDEQGVVRFEGVPTWPDGYGARATVPDHEPPDLGAYDGPLPDAEQLRGRLAVPAEPLMPEPNTERRVVLRLRPVGYVSAVLKPAAGRTTQDYDVYLDEAGAAGGADTHYHRHTGQFVAGPFAPGEVKLRLFCRDKSRTGGGQYECASQVAKVEPGRVTTVELTAPAGDEAPAGGGAEGDALLGLGGIFVRGSWADRLAGRVLLPGGKEPALGAVVRYFEPGRWEPVLGGLADARGEVRGRGLWYSGDRQTSKPPDDPPGPLIVATLPGSHGAAVASPPARRGEALELVLPPALSLRGKVTVAGAPGDAAHRGGIRVVAAHRGKGRLDAALSVQATAQADGSFELTGLTPGNYHVQAALDDIWLSPAVAVAAAADRPPADIDLTIPAPGGPAVVKVLDKDGKPLPGRAVTIGRPDGPLADLLWPGEFKTDGAGNVHLPALESGRHTVAVKGVADASATVDVAPLPAGGDAVVRPAVVTIRVLGG